MDTITLCLFHNITNDYFSKSKFKWITVRNENTGLIRYIILNNCKLEYIHKYCSLRLTFSATKFLYGNNYSTLKCSDIDNLIRELDLFLKVIFKFNLPTVTKWNITRLDLAANYTLSSQNDKELYLDLIKKISIPYCKTTLYSSSSHSKNKTRCYNLYDKNKECISSPKEILRIEIQLKNRALYDLVKNNTFEEKTFGCVLNSLSTLDELFSSHLIKLGLNKKIATSDNIVTVLNKLYFNNTIGSRTLNNMTDYYLNKKEPSKNTLNNYKHILAKLNFSNLTLQSRPSNILNFMNFKLLNSITQATICKTKLILKMILIFILSNMTTVDFKMTIVKSLKSKIKLLLNSPNYIDDS